MPADLNRTYDEVIERINHQNEEDKNLAWLTLSWITNAKRPLRPLELREALAIEPDATELDRENFLDMHSILSVCAGLVVINEEDDRVRLIHYTMQEYLEWIRERKFPRADRNIAVACIKYLLFPRHARNLRDLFTTNPFLKYAVDYGLLHARGQPEFDIKEPILSFLDQCSAWVDLWNMSHPFEQIPNPGTKPWIAAFFHLEQIVEDLADDAGFKPALYTAIQRGRTDVTRILVGQRSCIELLGEQYGSALHLAISRGTRIYCPCSQSIMPVIMVRGNYVQHYLLHMTRLHGGCSWRAASPQKAPLNMAGR
jgi:hypothetical protein